MIKWPLVGWVQPAVFIVLYI
ncbi:hypothetical protein ACFQNF_08575 [Iodobacter arcticus]|uniref:Uncharacterized protein n=1 Tax=Iodobacter arcticus TaxID=590593 RepID=A0ABW2QWF9_9NEIS